MKQTTNKMFRGCPYEMENFENCSFCPNYRICLKKKKERTRIRRMDKRIRCLKRIIVALILMLCVTLTILVISKIQDKNNKTMDTIGETEVTTNFKDTQVEPKAVISADGPSDTYYYHISEEDKTTIAKVVWAEARGECFEGKVAVAAVVLNRYYSGISYFDTESILAVATQPYQFASIENVTNEKLEQYPDCIQAVEAACKGWDPTRVMFSEGALYFYAPKYVSGYQKEVREGIRVLVIGNHNFHYDFNKVD